MKPLKNVAEELGINLPTLMREHRAGNLPLVVVGKAHFVQDADLEAWLASKRVAKPKKRATNPAAVEKMQKARAARTFAKKDA